MLQNSKILSKKMCIRDRDGAYPSVCWEKSCNYFFYETGDRMGIETLAKYARYFGLGVKTGIELPLSLIHIY